MLIEKNGCTQCNNFQGQKYAKLPFLLRNVDGKHILRSVILRFLSKPDPVKLSKLAFLCPAPKIGIFSREPFHGATWASFWVSSLISGWLDAVLVIAIAGSPKLAKSGNYKYFNLEVIFCNDIFDNLKLLKKITCTKPMQVIPAEIKIPKHWFLLHFTLQTFKNRW